MHHICMYIWCVSYISLWYVSCMGVMYRVCDVCTVCMYNVCIIYMFEWMAGCTVPAGFWLTVGGGTWRVPLLCSLAFFVRYTTSLHLQIYRMWKWDGTRTIFSKEEALRKWLTSPGWAATEPERDPVLRIPQLMLFPRPFHSAFPPLPIFPPWEAIKSKANIKLYLLSAWES